MACSLLIALTLVAPAIAQDVASHQPNGDHYVLNTLFGEDVLSTNVFAMMERAAEREDNERYRFLSGYVLPGDGHQSPRLAGEFHNSTGSNREGGPPWRIAR